MHRRRLLLLVALLPLAPGCELAQRISPAAAPAGAPATPHPTPSPLVLAPAKSAVVGQVQTSGSGQRRPLAGTVVALARVHWNPGKTEGAFVFEGATSPRAISADDGSFAIVNVDPADYVIVVGDPLGRNEIVSQPDGKARVFSAEVGRPLDVGRLEVRLTP